MRAQGIPLSLLVIAGLGLLVLGVVAAGFLLGWGKIGSGISSLFSGSTSQTDVEAARVNCQTLCRQIDGILSNPCDANSYSYCTKTFDTSDGTVNCYSITSCTVNLLSGARKTIDSSYCSDCDETCQPSVCCGLNNDNECVRK